MKKSVSGNSKRRFFVFTAGAVLAGAALYHLAGIGMEYKGEEDAYREISESVVNAGGNSGEPDRETKDKAEKEEFDYRKVRIDFDRLKKTNEDIIGWILFDKNGISYPVLQGEDNEEYLTVMADKTKNPAGSIFMDAFCSPDFTDSHTIIYGHNMRNLSMFGKLKNYRLDEDYYEENKYFTIYTPDMIYRYLIFAWYETEKDDGVYQVGYLANKTFQNFIESMIDRSYRKTEIEVDRKDKVATLSTCSANEKRFVVHGKLIASGRVSN